MKNIKAYPDKEKFCQLAQEYNVIPFVREILADDLTPVSVVQKIYKARPSGSLATLKDSLFLFESVEGGERWARYSFMGLSAKMRIKVFRDKITIENNDGVSEISHQGKPLEVLRGLMSDLRLAEVEGLPRFCGGLVGYFTYEMVSFFENIPNQVQDEVLACFIVPENILVFDNVKHTLGMIVLSFLDQDTNPQSAYEDARSRADELAGQILSEKMNNRVCRSVPHAMKCKTAKEDYMSSVNKVKEHITKGDIIQAVIAQQFEFDAPDDVIALYRAQRYINPSPYLYFMDIDHRQIIGASPETMVRLENGVATVRPIAGTRPRGDNEQIDRKLADELMLDEKERAEHVMLVDLGRNDLGKIAKTGSVHVTDFMFVERYSHVMHLVSNINCHIEDGKDAFDLIQCAFPAGTLSGAPKVRAMEIISEQEDFIRGPYGGCLGYISFNGNMDMAITIRTACIEDGKMTVTAGAGIVYDSVAQTEYEETLNKSRSVVRALEMVNSLQERGQ